MHDAQTFEVRPRPCWIAGQPEQGERNRTVRHPYDGTDVADIAVPGAAQVERAVAAAADVAAAFAATPAYERADALTATAARIAERADEIAETITAESGKPLTWAEVEVEHAATAFRQAAEEASRLGGDLTMLDGTVDGVGRLAITRRRPRGPVLAIAPFPAPLGVPARQIAAALAVGAPVIVKPAAAAPLTTLLLGEILAEAGLPDGVFSVLPLAGADMRPLVADPRLPVLAFAGSAEVAGAIADAAPRKRIVAEVGGGGAAAVLCADWNSDADLDFAASRIATAGGAQAGQAGTAVRRVLVNRGVAERFVPRLVATVGALRTGDPFDPAVEVGPMIDEAAAERVEKRIIEAIAAGAMVLAGGQRSGSTVAPTVLLDSPGEIRGPVLAVSIVDGVPAVPDSVTRCGVFTRDMANVFQIAAGRMVDGVVVGDVPADRGDVRSTMIAYTRAQSITLTGLST